MTTSKEFAALLKEAHSKSGLTNKEFAAKERYAETDGECSLFVMTRIPLERRDTNAKAEDRHKA